MAKTNVKYIDRTIIYSHLYIGLCLSEEHYLAEMKRLKVDDPWPWPGDNTATTIHYAQHDKVHECCIVCVNGVEKHHDTEVCGLLVHEAVHVWQKILDNIKETCPGREIEAYGIQSIAQGLIEAYRKMTNTENK